MSSVTVEVVTRETIELKPCPLCAGSANPETLEVAAVQDGDIPEYAVKCNECFCEGPVGKYERDAVVGWNNHKRAKKNTSTEA